MFQLFSNKVAEQYSWIGFKGKNNFSLLRISAAIIKVSINLIYTLTREHPRSAHRRTKLRATINTIYVKKKYRGKKY